MQVGHVSGWVKGVLRVWMGQGAKNNGVGGACLSADLKAVHVFPALSGTNHSQCVYPTTPP